jgi:hypothetical protein
MSQNESFNILTVLGIGLGPWVIDTWGRAEALNYEDLG